MIKVFLKGDIISEMLWPFCPTKLNIFQKGDLECFYLINKGESEHRKS